MPFWLSFSSLCNVFSAILGPTELLKTDFIMSAEFVYKLHALVLAFTTHVYTAHNAQLSRERSPKFIYKNMLNISELLHSFGLIILYWEELDAT